MDFSAILKVVLGVIKTPAVIIVFAVVILYLNFFNYIAHYRKRPKIERPVKKVTATSSEGDASGDKGEDSDEE